MQRENAYALRGFPQAGQNVLRPSPIPSTVQTLFFDFTPLSFKFYIKPQRSASCTKTSCSYILSKIYIKPQRLLLWATTCTVVSYQKSTSNHNCNCVLHSTPLVVSYQKSTSNHNAYVMVMAWIVVVSYQKSTSNHNRRTEEEIEMLLYLIKNLHQTTTNASLTPLCCGCILSKIYIKPQRPATNQLIYCVIYQYHPH